MLWVYCVLKLNNFHLVLIIFLISKTIFAYTSSICAQVPDGYFVRSSKSCNSYNRCINGQVISSKCIILYSRLLDNNILLSQLMENVPKDFPLVL